MNSHVDDERATMTMFPRDTLAHEARTMLESPCKR